MNKLLLIASLCCLYFENLQAAPLVGLIISPCDYHEKDIDTYGFLAYPNPAELDKPRLYLSLDDFKYNNFEHSIIVNIPERYIGKRELFANQFVYLYGTFSCVMRSHARAGLGGFEIVDGISLARKTANYNIARFEQGEVKGIKDRKFKKFGREMLKQFSSNKSNRELYDSIFETGYKEMGVKLERVDWVFDTFLSEFRAQKYKLCKLYEYEHQFFADSPEGEIEGLICFAKKDCSKFDNIKYGENLPHWLDESDEVCFETTNKINESRDKNKLSIFQFY